MTTPAWLEPPRDANGFMDAVLIALVPGIVAQVVWFGLGPLVVLASAALGCIAGEALALHLRAQPIALLARDRSALVTAMLIAASLPPVLPLHVGAIAGVLAILLGKQAFGGLGQNPFNPAMVGYVGVLLAFPADVARWPLPDGFALPLFVNDPGIDGFTAATALDAYKQRGALTPGELAATHAAFGAAGGQGLEWINLAWLAGGAWLLARRVITWHAPIGMLAALTLLAAIGWRGDSAASLGSPLLHLFAGGTMLAAFFVVTDPVTGPASRGGQVAFGCGVGALAFAIRAFGAHPDGIAFAVLLMNAVAPLIDRAALSAFARR